MSPHPISPQQSFDLDIEGMSCASCVGRVERTLHKVAGVDKVSVNLATEQAHIEAQASVQIEQLLQVLDKAGYPATLHPTNDTKKIELAIEGMQCASCVGRVERSLKKINGVQQASVNLATERAKVEINAETSVQQLIEVLTSAGYPASLVKAQIQQNQHNLQHKREQEAQHLRGTLMVAAILALPVFVLEMGGHLFHGFHHWIAMHIGSQNSWYLQFILTTLVLIFPARRFYQLGIPALLRATPDMNALVAVGTLAAYGYSVMATFLPEWLPAQSIAVYYESAVVIVVLILFGRYLEARAKGRTSQAISHLIALQPKVAHRKNGDDFEDVEISSLQPQDIILVKPSEKIPTDGIVIDGTSYVDESMMTGESLASHKSIHDAVIGGTLNQQGRLIIQTTAVGEHTVLAQIIQTVEQAQANKLPIQTAVDRITLWFVPMVMLIALITFILWMVFAPHLGLNYALVHAVAVLIIACPCAMGLATPTSIMVATGRAAEMGVLFRQGAALQQLKETKIIAFDKTGTLTKGQPELTDFVTQADQEQAQLLVYAASLEAQSEHPIAQAIVKAAQQQQLPCLPISNFQTIVGQGIQASIEGQQVYLGSASFMQSLGLSIADFHVQADQWAKDGKSPFYLAVEQSVTAIFAVSDALKPESQAAISALHQLGLKVAMISGDHHSTADAIAKQLQIDLVMADCLPNQKVEALQKLQQQYGTIAFVGDGINDAPALAAADVGIAIGTGTDVAIETADVVLMSGHLQGVINALHISQLTLRNIQQNLFWAFAYNVVLIPSAAGLFYPINGNTLSPMFAAAAMALSSVFVLSNALRLRSLKVKKI